MFSLLPDVQSRRSAEHRSMFQGIRELRAARGRAALIIATITLITVLVTFLSSLAAGLSYQSVSALQERLGSNTSLAVEDTGTTTLASSRLTDEQTQQITNAGGEILYMARTRIDEQPTVVLSSSTPLPDDLYFDHQPARFESAADVSALPGATSAGVLPAGTDVNTDGLTVLEGKDRWNASSSYAGEQMSLNLMINLLYVISALVLGAFFTVWTLQRLRGVVISAALGASRRVRISDAMGQAFLVLLTGIGAGVLLTWGASMLIGGSIPIEISAATLALPAVILGAAGLAGSAVSLKPVLGVEPRSALANV